MEWLVWIALAFSAVSLAVSGIALWIVAPVDYTRDEAGDPLHEPGVFD